MSETMIDSLGLEVTSNAQSAENGLNALASTLEKLKTATKGGLGLTAVIKQMKSAGEAAKGIDAQAVSNLNGLAHAIQTLTGISANLKISPAIPKQILAIGEASKALEGYDFTPLTELSSSLGLFGGLENVKIPPSLGDKILNLGYKADLLNNYDFTKLHELATEMKALESVENINMPSVRRSIGAASSPSAAMPFEASSSANAISGIAQIEQACENATSAASELKSKITDVRDAADLSAPRRMFERFREAITSNTERVAQFLASLKRIAMYRAIRAILSSITNSLKEGIGNVYQYSKLIDGDFAVSMDKLATGALYLKNSLGAMFSPIINIAVPVIDSLIDKIVEATNAFNRFVAFLSGASSWTKALRYPKEYAEAAGSAKDAVDKLKNTILGIDELNLMADNSNKDYGSSSSDLDYSKMFEQVEISEEYRTKWQWLKDIVDNIKEIWSGMTDIEKVATLVGVAIAAWAVPPLLTAGLRTALSSLGKIKALSAIKIGITLLVSGIALEWDGIVKTIKDGLSKIDFTEIISGAFMTVGGGATIGSGIAGVIGAALGAGIAAIIAGIPAYIVGIYDAIKEGLNWMNGMLIPFGSTLAGAGIGAIIGACGGPIGMGIGALIGLVIGALTDLGIWIYQHWGEISEKLSEIWDNISGTFTDVWENVVVPTFEKMKEAVEPAIEVFKSLWEDVLVPFGEFIIDVFTPVVETAKSIFEEFWKNVIVPFGEAVEEVFFAAWETLSTFYTNVLIPATEELRDVLQFLWNEVIVPLAGFVGGELYSAWKALCGVFDEKIIPVISGAIEKLEYLWHKVGEPIATWMQENLLSVAKDVFEDIGEHITGFKELLVGVLNYLTSVFENDWQGSWEDIKENLFETWGAIPEKVEASWKSIKETCGAIAGWFEEKVSNPVKEVFEGMWESVKSTLNAMLGGIESMANGIIKGLNGAINSINSFNFDLPDWIPIVGGKSFGLNLSTISSISIPRLAEGGVPATGELFIAREAGAELVGNVGSRTAVMNNDQIVESVSRGVADANAEQVAALREQNAILRKLLEKDTTVAAVISTSDITTGMARKNRRDGKTVVPVGV